MTLIRIIQRCVVRSSVRVELSSLSLRFGLCKQRPVYEISFNNVVAHVFHKRQVGLRSAMQPASYLNKISTMEGGSLPGDAISLIITSLMFNRTHPRVDVGLLRMPLDPGDLYRARTL